MPIGIYPFEKRRGMFKKGHVFPKEILEKMSKSLTGKHHTEATKQKIRETNIRIGRKPPTNYGNFKEGIFGKSRYISIHAWVVREKGKPTTCEQCGKEGLTGHKIQWANKDHKYARNIDDYMRLCGICHRKYDRENFSLYNSSK